MEINDKKDKIKEIFEIRGREESLKVIWQWGKQNHITFTEFVVLIEYVDVLQKFWIE